MRKEPNKTVAKLRGILGKTQEQFAVMLGVSKDTIVSVENGRNRMSPGLAARIHIATGVNKPDLLENTGKLTSGGDEPYRGSKTEFTLESFHKWQSKVFGTDHRDPAGRKQAAQFFFDQIKGRLEVLLVASTRPGPKGRDRFPAVIQSLESWLQHVYDEFELANEVDEVLREETTFAVTNRLSIGFLRDAMKQGNPMKFKFKDSKKYKDTDKIVVEYDQYDHWDDPYIPPLERQKIEAANKTSSKAEREWDFEKLFVGLESKKPA